MIFAILRVFDKVRKPISKFEIAVVNLFCFCCFYVFKLVFYFIFVDFVCLFRVMSVSVTIKEMTPIVRTRLDHLPVRFAAQKPVHKKIKHKVIANKLLYYFNI